MSKLAKNLTQNLSQLRGFANMNAVDKELSPRVRQLRVEDLLPPTEPDEDDSDDDGTGKRGVKFGKVTSSKSFAIQKSTRTKEDLDDWYNCCGSRVCFPFTTLVISLFFAIGLALYIWIYRKPVVREGAFGKLAQNIRPESVQEANFVKARVRAVSGPTLLGLDVGGNGTIVGAAEGFEWRRVEIIYQLREEAIVKGSVLEEANKWEKELTSLPGWQRLCETRVPPAQQKFCNPGDSFPAVLYASEQEVTGNEAAEGVLVENMFDGKADGAFLPLHIILEFLTNFHAEVFKRWFKVDVERTDVTQARVMRTMFSFYLPTMYALEWTDFVNVELEDKLKEGALKGIQPANTKLDVAIFYRADGVAMEEFAYAVDNAIIWACVAACGAFISTVVVTRRILLGLAALGLAGIASATSAALISQWHEDGFVEFPVVAISSWFLNAVSAADLAIACVTAWETEDPFPRTAFGETIRILADRLHRCAMPDQKRRIRMCMWHGLQGCLWVMDTSFPARREDRPLQTPLTEWFAFGRMYWFGTSLLLPQFVCGCVFILISMQTELLLLQEFTMHAGPGLIASSIFAVLLYPPVLDLGDVLNLSVPDYSCIKSCASCCERRRLLRPFVACVKKGHCLPWECGSRPEWRRDMRRPTEVFAYMLNARPMRVIGILTTALVVVGFSLSEFTSSFVATPPPLFPAGHRSREGPKVREIFGMMPRSLEAPANTLTSARKCTPDAFDNATCSWYKCELDQQLEPDHGKCICKYRYNQELLRLRNTTTTTQTTTTIAAMFTTLRNTITATGSCSSMARIAGVADTNLFPQAEFWTWAEEQLGLTLGDGSNQVLKPEQIGSIEMEDWRTGEMKAEKQFSIGMKLADEDVPSLEDACVSILCYCGISPCDLDPEWQLLGQIKYTDAPPTTTDKWRRLNSRSTAIDQRQSISGFELTSTKERGLHLDAEWREKAFKFLERRILPESGVEPLFDQFHHRRLTVDTASQEAQKQLEDINIIWGLKKTTEIPFRTTQSELKFNASFVMQNPWSQRAIIGVCEGLSPDLLVEYSACWIEDFKRYVMGNGQVFPVPSHLFYSWFFQFSVWRYTHHDSASNKEGGSASGGAGYDYFWLSEEGIVQGTFATFKVLAPAETKAAKEFMMLWIDFIQKRNKMSGIHTAMAEAWIASPLFAQSQTIEIVRTSCYLTVGGMLLITCCVIFLLTCSLGITVAILTSLLVSLCTFGTFWTGLGNRDVGSMEIVSLSVFLSGTITPLIRVAHAYSFARDRPYLPADMMTLETQNRTSMAEMTKDDREEISKHYADEMGEGEILMFPGAINNERQSRVATAMQRGGAPALGLGGAAVIGGLALLPLEMEALGQCGLAILCMGFAVPVAVGLLAMLLLMGLGDSKARQRAFQELARFVCGRLSGKVHSDKKMLGASKTAAERRKSAMNEESYEIGHFKLRDTVDKSRQSVATLCTTGGKIRLGPQVEAKLPDHKPHTMAALMLGAPVQIAMGNTSAMFKPFGKGKKKKEDTKLPATDEEVGDEAGPCILTLDVQGATAKPPYHIVMATRDVINVKG